MQGGNVAKDGCAMSQSGDMAKGDEIAEELTSIAELIESGAVRSASVVMLRDGGREWVTLDVERDNVVHIVMPAADQSSVA